MYHNCEPRDNARPASQHIYTSESVGKGDQGTNNCKNNPRHFRCIKYLAV